MRHRVWLASDPAGGFTVPTEFLFHGEYKRAGNDLKIIGEHGKTFVVHDYFKTDQLHTLFAPDGAALSGDIVVALTGPLAPGEYAQATPPQNAGEAIGRVATLSGSAVAVRNGVAVALNVGDVVLKGDVVQTQGGSAIGVIFADGSTFDLGANARMVLNEFVYNPAATSGNSSLINLVQGSIVFVAGQVAHTGDMKVGTPSATMGIRGTAVQVDIDVNNGTTQLSVLIEPGGHVGSFNIYSLSGQLIGTANNAKQSVDRHADVSIDAVAAETQQNAGPRWRKPLLTCRPRFKRSRSARRSCNSIRCRQANRTSRLHKINQIKINMNNQQQNQNPTQNTRSRRSRRPMYRRPTIANHARRNPRTSLSKPKRQLLPRRHAESSPTTVPLVSAPLPPTDTPPPPPPVNTQVFFETNSANTSVHVSNATAPVNQAGVLLFTGGDTHSVSVTPHAGNVGSLSAAISQDTTSSTEGDIAYTYTAPQGQNPTQPDVFDVTVTDNLSGSAATTSISFVLQNHNPVAMDATYTVTETQIASASSNSQFVLPNVLANVSDPDGDTVTVSAISAPTVSKTGAGLVVLSVKPETAAAGEVARYDIQTNYGDAHVAVGSDGQIYLWSNTGDDPFKGLGANETATINFNYTVDDGFGGSATAGTSITINGANDAAVVAGTASGAVTEAGGVNNGTPGTPTLSGTLTDTDVDNPANTFQAVAAGTASDSGYGSYAMAAGGTWTYTLNNNNAAVQALNVGGTLTDTFTVHTQDGTAQQVTVTINGADDAPVLGNAGNTIGYTELQVVPPAIDAVLTVADVDNANLASATVSIASGFFAGDALNFTNQNGITGSYNGATGVLTLTGTATVAQYQAALESVTFSSSSANPTHFGTDSGRSISWVVNDGTLNSAAQTTTVNITAVDNAPVIANVSGTVSTNQNTPVPLIAPNGTVTDVDAAPSDLLLATLSVAHGTLTPIGSVAGLTIVNGQDGSNGTLSFTGTQAAITQAIDTGVTYAPSLNYNGSDTLTFTVNDQGHTGSGGPQTATATVGIVVSSDQAPTLGNAGNTIGYTELQVVPPAIDAVLTVADVDNANLASATVSIASGFFAGDALNFTNQNGITGSYNGATGVLTLTGTATVAQYQAALESVTFSSSSANPTHFGTDSGRSISWVVNDGTLNSAAQTTTVNITAVDNAPVIANVSGTVSTNQNTPVPLIAPNGTVTDVDAAPSDLLLATLSVAHGTLTPIGSVAGLTIVNGQDGSNGTLSFTGTQAAITQAIDTGVTYAPSLNYNGSDTLTFTVNDQGHTGSGGPQTATATVGIVVSSDQAPTLGNAGNTIGYTELQVVPPAIDAVLTVADVDNANLASATVSIASGFFAGDALNFTNQNGITGSYNGATGVLTLTGTATVAQYQAALELVTFSSSSANPTHFGTDSGRSISWVVNDGTLNSAAQTTTVNITAVDNAPVIANVSGTVSTNQNTPVPLIAPNGTVTDVDAAPSDLLLATLSVAHGTLTPIGSVAGLTIVNGQDGSNGTLSFTGTQAAITQAIDTGVTYAPSLNYNGSDTLTFTVNDQGHTGSGGPQTATATVGIVVSSDQAPTLGNAGNTIGYTELQVVPPAIDAVLTVADVDNANLASATVSIASGFFAGDALNFTNQNGITGSYNGATGVLTLTGTATVAQYQAALELVHVLLKQCQPDPLRHR